MSMESMVRLRSDCVSVGLHIGCILTHGITHTRIYSHITARASLTAQEPKEEAANTGSRSVSAKRLASEMHSMYKHGQLTQCADKAVSKLTDEPVD